MEDKLHQVGVRPTKARLALLKALFKANSPETAGELLSRLRSQFHKVTLYRDLHLFVKTGLVEKMQFSERSARYQAKTNQHSHHLICENCGLIDEIELPNDLDREESRIAQRKNFLVTAHSLEFYGKCASCQR